MNMKVDDEFKYIHDEYLLQCICTELKIKLLNQRNEIINFIKEHCIDDEFYSNLTNKEKYIIDLLILLENGSFNNDN